MAVTTYVYKRGNNSMGVYRHSDGTIKLYKKGLIGEFQQLGSDIDGEAANDELGIVSLNSDGTRIAIGARLNDSGGNNSGHVRIFSWDGSSWNLMGSEIVGDFGSFGHAVELSADGNRVVVGAPTENTNGDGAGQVQVYEWNGSAWSQLGSDINGDSAGDAFGYSVSIDSDGSRIVAGAPADDGGGNSSGQVKVYDWNGSAWAQVGSDINGAGVADSLGYSVSMSSNGSKIAVGAYERGNGGPGYVNIFEYSSSSWSKVGSDIEGTANAEECGSAVSLNEDGTIVAVGSSSKDFQFNNSGMVRVFSWDGSSWSQRGSTIYGESNSEGYGGRERMSLSNDGGKLVIGVPLHDSQNGHARVFHWNGSAWVQFGSNLDSENTDDQFGSSASISKDGKRVAVAGRYNDGGGVHSGHVRIFKEI